MKSDRSMALYVFDTNALSDMMGDDEAFHSRLGRSGERCAMSVISRGEIQYGLNRMPPGRRRRNMASKAAVLFRAVPALAITAAVADEYGSLRRETEKQGSACDNNDLWIAASCLQAGAILVSRDAVFQRLPRIQVEMW